MWTSWQFLCKVKQQETTVAVPPSAHEAVARLKQERVGLFDVNKSEFLHHKILRNISDNYMPWCCYSLCGPSCAMYSLGVKLGEKWRFHYILIGVSFIACYAFLKYAKMNEIDDETLMKNTIITVLTLVTLILVCLLRGLAICQRMRFFKQQGRKEDLCFSCFASICCLSCSYGQMGAVEIQTVWF